MGSVKLCEVWHEVTAWARLLFVVCLRRFLSGFHNHSILSCLQPLLGYAIHFLACRQGQSRIPGYLFRHKVDSGL